MNIDPAWLAPTYHLDYQMPSVQDFVREAVGDASAPRDQAIRLYYAVRDRIRYDPYSFRMDREFFRASHTLALGASYCVPKAVLYAAGLRSLGIPARPGFADVRNHLATERLRKAMGTDVFSWHGYTSVMLEGKWIKATPVFNIEMCERFGVLPLDFDGVNDSVMQPYDARKQRHMEYLKDHGAYDDLPFELLTGEMLRDYPEMIAAVKNQSLRDFEHDKIHSD